MATALMIILVICAVILTVKEVMVYVRDTKELNRKHTIESALWKGFGEAINELAKGIQNVGIRENVNGK